MSEYRWLIITVILIVAFVIILDEIAYNRWKTTNPGAQWSKAQGETAPLVNPEEPPRRWY